MPTGTPVTAVWSGVVTKRYYDAGGGQVIIKIDDTSKSRGTEYYNFRHLDEISTGIQIGTRVKPGDIIGQSGGQNSGGNHPAATNYSSGPHLGVGVSHGNWIPYTLETLTPDLDPQFMINYAKGVGQQESCNCKSPDVVVTIDGEKYCKHDNGDGTASYKSCKVVVNPDYIGDFFKNIQEASKWIANPIRIIKLLLGIMLIGGAIFLMISPQSQMARTVRSAYKGVNKVL